MRKSREIDEIVLATVSEPENEPLRTFAEKIGMPVFWFNGDVNHVTTRLRNAAEAYKADICILVSGDCPLVDAPAIDHTIHQFRATPEMNNVRYDPDADGNPPALQGIVVSRISAWQLADDLADRPELKEHQFPVMGLRPELFSHADVQLPENYYMPFHRLSVDTYADLEFMNQVYAQLDKKDRTFSLPNAVALILDKPGLRTINSHVHQQKLVEDSKSILFVVDCGLPFGSGHLMRSIELAHQMTERLGWPAHFLIDDDEARTILHNHGIKTRWGAFARAARPNPADTPCTLEHIAIDYDIMVFDVFDQRGPAEGWRDNIRSEFTGIVIENQQDWTNEADLIIVPSPMFQDISAVQPQEGVGLSDVPDSQRPKIVGGQNHIILRRELRRIAQDPPERQWDLLVYLHDLQRRRAIENIGREMDLRCKIIDHFSDRFLVELASSDLFISGFGISFYEALALKTVPVCWPDSTHHGKDAQQFYQHMDIGPYIIDSSDKAKTTIVSALADRHQIHIDVQDGTPEIVREIKEFLSKR